MMINDKDPAPAAGSLSPGQQQSLLKMEPKTLGAIQIVIAALILCLSASMLRIPEVHFTGDVALFLVVVIQVKGVLVLHLISVAFSTAALGLMSKHLPYRQDSYHCEHCHRLELYAVLLIDGILVTLVIFLVLELLICITAMLFGLSILAAGGTQASSQRPVYPQSRPPVAPAVQAVQVPAAAAEPHGPQVAVVVTEADSDQIDDVSTPPTEPQVEPIEAQP